MKLFSCFTQSHAPLKEEWFEPTLLQNDYDELVMPFKETADWLEGIRFKIDVILSAMGSPFVWCDVDSQWFGPTHDALLQHLNGYDIVFSRDDQAGRFNSGLFVCSGSDRMRTLWEAVKAHCAKYSQNDQEALMHKLRGHKKLEGMRWAILPDSYYCSGIETSRPWRPGVPLSIPQEQAILVHHAAWARGIEDKIAQLQYVRNLQEQLA